MSESQNKAIKDWMQRGYEITPIEALKRFKCMRLASRIGDLKKEGLNIADRWVKSNGKRLKAYRMATDKASLSKAVGL